MKKSVLMVGLVMLGTGCEVPPEVKTAITEIKIQLGLTEKTLPKEVQEEMSHAEVPVEKDKAANAGALARENSEILSEMVRVVFDQEDVEDKSDFGQLAHSLNEGASLEGIYRGLIAGSRYRALESKSQAASPAELKVFSNELMSIQAEMQNPTRFDPGTAKKVPTIEFPDGSEADPKDEAQAEANSQPDFLHMFIGASSFTLKRVLADEVLKKIDETTDPGAFAKWYAQWVVRWCDANVDFGLALRNRPDLDFHFKFAQKMARDRVKWEALNRVHRLLNAASKQK